MSRKAITKKLKRAQKLAEQAKNMADRQRLGREKKFILPGRKPVETEVEETEVVETEAEEQNSIEVAEVDANIKSPVTEENMTEDKPEVAEAVGITVVDGSVPFVKESLAGVHHKANPGATEVQNTPVVSVVDRAVEAKGKVNGQYRVGPNWYCITKGQTLFIPPDVKAHFREHGLVE